MSNLRCENCQHFMKEDYNFCPVCGAAVMELVTGGSFGPVLIPKHLLPNGSVPAPNRPMDYIQNPKGKENDSY